MYLHILRYIIGGNHLSGTIPSELALLTNLEMISLRKYDSRVDLCLEEHGWNLSSTSNFALSSFLHDALILEYNNLSGSVPSELFALPKVRIGVRKWIW